MFVLKLKGLFPFFQETVFAMLVETTGNIPYFMYMYACPLTVCGSPQKSGLLFKLVFSVAEA